MTDGNIEFWRGWLATHGKRAAARMVDADLKAYCYDGLSATMRNRLRFAERNDYTSRVLSVQEFNQRVDEVWQIRCSTPERQGLPMRPAYMNKPNPLPDLEYNTIYGCFTPDDVLVAYIIGQYTRWLAAASTIIGHYKHIGNSGVMVKVWFEFMTDVIQRGSRYVVYSKWTDGTDGLRAWKRSVGLQEIDLSGEQL